MSRHRTLFQRLFCDANGNVVLVQFPNVPLLLWIGLSLLRIYSFPVIIDVGIGLLANSFLFVWAYLEITSGVNYFRRILGAIIFFIVASSYFI